MRLAGFRVRLDKKVVGLGNGAATSKRIVSSVLALFFAASCVAIAAPESRVVRSVQLRPFTVNDLFRLQGLGGNFGGPYAYSAATGQLAVTILRPIDTDPSQRWSGLYAGTLQSNGRGDIWVQLAAGKPLTDITRGASDKSGWFSPQWAPDGIHLAMLSTRGGELRLWTWNRRTGRLRPLSGDEVTFSFSQPAYSDYGQPYVWLDSRDILCTVMPKSQRREFARMYEYADGSQTPALAVTAWRRYLSGTIATASTLDDGTASGSPPGADLVLINLDGRERVLATNMDTVLWQPSPTGGAVAFTRQEKAIPKYSKYFFPDHDKWRLEVVTADGRRIVTTGEQAREVIPTSLRWSLDGGILAYLGYASESQIAPSLYLLDMRTDRVRAIVPRRLNMSPGWHDPVPGMANAPSELSWTKAGDVLVNGVQMRASDQGTPTSRAREEWWLISPSGAQRCVTCRLGVAPTSLWPERGSERFFGVAGGRIWEFDVRSGNIVDVTADLHGSVVGLISPAYSPVYQQFLSSDRTVLPIAYTDAVFLSIGRRGMEPHLLEFRSRTVTNLSLPAEGASVASVSPDGKSILYLKNDRSGLSLWRGDVHSAVSKIVFSGNAFLNDIAEGHVRYFPYTSLDGAKLNAWILLPPGYRADRRYPMITWIYPSDSYSAPAIPGLLKAEAGLASEFVFNMQIAAAHGYAVLFPSIPVSYHDRDEVGIKVINDVLPAVNAAVRRGFADPRRLAVWGHSYGGEAVMDLITRTNRFQAAIASGGLSDFISAYGEFSAYDRYSKWAAEDVFGQLGIESGEENLGGPPWKEWLKYVQNSPIFSVDRVHTPILLIHGDLDDNVPMEQSEEYFRALARQGKPARFVRYWGEGHVPTSPANVRNYWWQVFRWLQRYIAPDGQK